MSRSLKKGPYVDEKLYRKVEMMSQQSHQREQAKQGGSRACYRQVRPLAIPSRRTHHVPDGQRHMIDALDLKHGPIVAAAPPDANFGTRFSLRRSYNTD